MSSSPEIVCPCCGHQQYQLVYSGMTSVYSTQPYSIYRCTTCEDHITWPLISAEELNRIYEQTYLYPVHLLAMGEKKFRSRQLADFIRSGIPSGTSKKILEVGCMFGHLLEELKNEYEVRGIDIGHEAVTFCREKGLNVDLISAEDFVQKNHQQFDLIVLSHVLEHLLDPSDVLKKFNSFLNPGGKIIVLVPNQASFCRKFFGRYWGWWQVPVHVNHFSINAMKKLSEKTGYKISAQRFRGGDSLMLLLNFVNLFRFRSTNKAPGNFQRTVIRIFTGVFRSWYFISNEEMCVVLSQSTGNSVNPND